MFRKVTNLHINFFDTIIIGGGHAGIEAVNITNKLNLNTLFITENIQTISEISCNPAIGGLGKGQLVKEINVIGGLMGKVTDLTGTNFQTLNKGKISKSTRIQIDKLLYSMQIQKTLIKKKKIKTIEQQIKKLIIINNNIIGIITIDNQKYYSKTIILSIGTFLNKKIINGLSLIEDKKNINKFIKLKFNNINTFKTGTPPRLINNINYKNIKKYKQKKSIPYINTINKHIKKKFIPYYKTNTNNNTIKIIKKYIKYSPRYAGLIKCKGPRYCPSIEDKIINFNKKIHNIFIEKESIINNIIYISGLSISLPNSIQNLVIKTIKGINNTNIIKYGYNVEYSYINPKELNNNLEHKMYKNLYFCGQINATSGYEESAAQGLYTGLSVFNKINKIKINQINHYNSYIGTLIHDLTNKNISEPYRLFTNRNQFKKLIREDNTYKRLHNIRIGINSLFNHTETNYYINDFKNKHKNKFTNYIYNTKFNFKNKLLLLINNLSNESICIIKNIYNNKFSIKKIIKLIFNDCLNKIFNFIKNIIYI